MKSSIVQAFGFDLHSSSSFLTRTIVLGLLAVPLMFAGRAAEPVQGGDEHPDKPKEVVTVERRVVSRDADERPALRDPGSRPPEPEARERHLEELHDRAADLRADGHAEEAERVEQEIREIEQQRRFDRPPPRRPGGPREGDDIGPLQERLNHLQIAAENLHAAGLPDLAQRVENEARETRRQLEEHARRGRPGMNDPREEIEQLRREVADLHRQIDELRRQTGRPRER